MISLHPHRPPQASARGFTMLEALLALFIFATAVISLVEAINATGRTVLLSRRERQVQERVEMLLLEATRSPDLVSRVRNKDLSIATVKEGDVTYVTRPALLDLQNEDGKTLPDMLSIKVTANWKEGREEQEVFAETWVFPPLFQPGPAVGTPTPRP